MSPGNTWQKRRLKNADLSSFSVEDVEHQTSISQQQSRQTMPKDRKSKGRHSLKDDEAYRKALKDARKSGRRFVYSRANDAFNVNEQEISKWLH